ncbi:MAG: YceI family protein [Bernardetiaceae bacterium]|jgi:polyisoprenoid-binding protein YceI|nr:YceI family protein [Bernardetiaceae bacterium]
MKNTFLAGLAAAVLLVAFTSKAPVETFKINPASSKIGWLGKKVTGQHNGAIMVKEGTLEVSKGKITGGSFVLDMNSITCEDITDAGSNAKLLGHLKSDDFFSVAKNPTGTFVIKKATAAGKSGKADKYNIEGDLTLKGIAKPVSFEALVTPDGKKMTATAAFKINRTHWDIKYGSGSFFEGLGDKMIYDDIELSLNAVFEK